MKTMVRAADSTQCYWLFSCQLLNESGYPAAGRKHSCPGIGI